MMETKTCRNCGAMFERLEGESDNSWRSRKCCSHDCLSKGIEKKCKECGDIFYTKKAHIKRGWGKYCSISCAKKGKIPPNLKIAQAASPIKKGNKIARALKGKKRPDFSKEWISNMRYAFKNTRVNHSGEDHWNWKGGVTQYDRALRRGRDYNEWRKMVYARDRWTCQECGIHCMAGNIIAHHIKSFHDYIELRHDIDNGITYCRACHASIHHNIKRCKYV